MKLTADIAARAVGCQSSEIFLASTGVIGEPLDATKFDGVLESLTGQLAAEPWMEPAKAIMTTDTFPKLAEATLEVDNAQFRLHRHANRG